MCRHEFDVTSSNFSYIELYEKYIQKIREMNEKVKLLNQDALEQSIDMFHNKDDIELLFFKFYSQIFINFQTLEELFQNLDKFFDRFGKILLTNTFNKFPKKTVYEIIKKLINMSCNNFETTKKYICQINEIYNILMCDYSKHYNEKIMQQTIKRICVNQITIDEVNILLNIMHEQNHKRQILDYIANFEKYKRYSSPKCNLFVFNNRCEIDEAPRQIACLPNELQKYLRKFMRHFIVANQGKTLSISLRRSIVELLCNDHVITVNGYQACALLDETQHIQGKYFDIARESLKVLDSEDIDYTKLDLIKLFNKTSNQENGWINDEHKCKQLIYRYVKLSKPSPLTFDEIVQYVAEYMSTNKYIKNDTRDTLKKYIKVLIDDEYIKYQNGLYYHIA